MYIHVPTYVYVLLLRASVYESTCTMYVGVSCTLLCHVFIVSLNTCALPVCVYVCVCALKPVAADVSHRIPLRRKRGCVCMCVCMCVCVCVDSSGGAAGSGR